MGGAGTTGGPEDSQGIEIARATTVGPKDSHGIVVERATGVDPRDSHGATIERATRPRASQGTEIDRATATDSTEKCAIVDDAAPEDVGFPRARIRVVVAKLTVTPLAT
jgi:hypothetical protein